MAALRNLHFVRELSGGLNNNGVYLLLDRDTGIYYVEKTYKSRHLRLEEHKVLSYMHSHPHIVHVRSSPNPDALLTQYCDLGTLDALAKRAGEARVDVPAEFLLKVVSDVLSALAWAHHGVDTTGGPKSLGSRQNGCDPLIHTDVHLGNILLHSVSRNIYPRAVLGDWGNARSPPAPTDTQVDLRQLAEAVRDFAEVSGMRPFGAFGPLQRVLVGRRHDAVEAFCEVVELQKQVGPPRKLSPRVLVYGEEIQPLKTAEPANGPLRDGGGVYAVRRTW